MKWNLIFTLSLLGFLMAIATVSLFPTKIEIWFWIPIFLWYAYIIARNVEENYFLHGLFLGIANSLWISFLHAMMFTKYIFNNGWVSETLAKLPTKGIGLTKKLLNESFQNDLQTQLTHEGKMQAVAAQTKEFKEAVAAFFQKKAAQK